MNPRLFAPVASIGVLLTACAVAVEAPNDSGVRRDATPTMDAPAMDVPVAPADAPLPPPDTAAPADTIVREASVEAGPVDAGCPIVGQLTCGGVCITPSSDLRHCGRCNNACAAGSVCNGGECQTTCTAPRTLCGGECRDTSTDLSNCGRCGNSCPSTPSADTTCAAGVCGNRCRAGFMDCDRASANGCEIAVGSDVNHCGACNNRCSVANGTAACAAGACAVASCAAGFGNCDGNAANGCEANTATDPMNCGGCGMRPTESCNGRDDNCSGVADEGFRATGQGPTFATLSTYLPSCNASNNYGLDCNAAINRFCNARGCTNGGFGPQELSASTAAVACVIATQRDTSFSVLSGFQGPCNGSSERFGPNCNAAIHRFCGAMGFASGFGPVENSGDAAVVMCVPTASATVMSATYTELRALHASCNGTSQRMGPNCNSAIHRWCMARGHVSGFGPVENVGDALSVVCVDQ